MTRHMKPLTSQTPDQELRTSDSAPALFIKLPWFPCSLLSSVEGSKLILDSFLAVEVRNLLLLLELGWRPLAVWRHQPKSFEHIAQWHHEVLEKVKPCSVVMVVVTRATLLLSKRQVALEEGRSWLPPWALLTSRHQQQ